MSTPTSYVSFIVFSVLILLFAGGILATAAIGGLLTAYGYYTLIAHNDKVLGLCLYYDWVFEVLFAVLGFMVMLNAGVTIGMTLELGAFFFYLFRQVVKSSGRKKLYKITHRGIVSVS